MSSTSKIGWTEATWNPVTGCSKKSDGCKNCYAERMAHRLKLTGTAHYKNGFEVTEHAESLSVPLKWKKTKTIFVCSMSDLFHEKVSKEFILQVFDVMNKAKWHKFLVLTKRPERLLELDKELPWSPNIIMGVTVESDKYINRIDLLKKCGAKARFLSLEPLISPLAKLDLSSIDWVIVGGESGRYARPMPEEWVLDIQSQCKELWDKVQDTLSKKAQRHDSRHNHTFKGLLRCQVCGCLYIGNLAKNRYGNLYNYYRCSGGKGKHSHEGYLKEESIAEQLKDCVNNVILPPDVIKLIIKGLKLKGLKASKITSTKKENLEADLREIKERLSKLLDMHLSGKVVNEEVFMAKQKELTDKQVNIESELSCCVDNPEETINKAVVTLEMTKNLEKYYKQCNNRERNQLIQLIAEDIIVTPSKQLVVNYREPFKTLNIAKMEAERAKNIPPLDNPSGGKSCTFSIMGG